MSNNSTSTPEIYTLSSNEKLTINGLNEVTNNLEIPIGFTTGVAGNLKIKASQISNFDEGTQVFLRDNIENNETELILNEEYLFNSQIVSNNETRFSIIFRAPSTMTNDVNKLKPNISAFINSTNEIMLHSPENAYFEIYDTVGQKLLCGFTSSSNTAIKANYIRGIYIVKININDVIYTNKLIIK